MADSYGEWFPSEKPKAASQPNSVIPPQRRVDEIAGILYSYTPGPQSKAGGWYDDL